MSDLIDDLSMPDKHKRNVRAALAADERVFDALELGGEDNFRMNWNGYLLVTDRQLLFVKDKLIGKAKLEPFTWDRVVDYGQHRSGTFFLVQVDRGTAPWTLRPSLPGTYDKGVTDKERDKQFSDRIMMLMLTVGEAKEAYSAEEKTRQAGEVGGMMEELRRITARGK